MWDAVLMERQLYKNADFREAEKKTEMQQWKQCWDYYGRNCLVFKKVQKPLDIKPTL